MTKLLSFLKIREVFCSDFEDLLERGESCLPFGVDARFPFVSPICSLLSASGMVVWGL